MSEIKFKKPAPTPPIALLKLMLKLGIKPPPPAPIAFPEDWASLSSDEKYNFYKHLMLSTEDREFVSAEVAEAFVRRTKRWHDVVDLKEPDEVPAYFMPAGVIVEYGGITYKDSFYDGEKMAKAIEKFQEDFAFEYAPLVLSTSGKTLDMLQPKVMRYPGSAGPNPLPDNTTFQYVEGEYMSVPEYDLLMANPDGFIQKEYIPRVYRGLQGFKEFPSYFIPAVGPSAAGFFLMTLSMGSARESLELMLKAADHTLEFMMPQILVEQKMTAKLGVPGILGGLSMAPFDMLGDTWRGTKGILMDMYRNPEKVKAACEILVSECIQLAIESCTMKGVPYVFIPLHKGAEGFMSNEHFQEFYWATYKKVLLGIIDEGLIPVSFVEGSYNPRLDIIADSGLPKGKTIWWFDQTDMKAAKEKLGDFACIGGNIPASILATGTPKDIEVCVKDLIETCAPGGGFFLTPGAPIDHARPENIHAYINTAKKYGVY